MNTVKTLFRQFRVGILVGIFSLFAAAFGQTLIFTNAMIANGKFQFQVLTSSNVSFTIQDSADLVTWTSVGSMTAISNSLTVTDPRGLNGDGLFYRLVPGASQGNVSYSLSFLEFADAGSFGNSLSPNTSFPVTLDSYSAEFNVGNDTNYPVATNVFFTGPAGSGLTNSPADPNNSNTNGSPANYQSLIIVNPPIAAAGTWTINYKGSNQVFSVPDPQAASHTVVPYPTVTVTGGFLRSVSWVYRDAVTGAALGSPPAYMTSIQVQVHGSSAANEFYDSDNLSPTTTNNAVSSSVTWPNVSGLSLAYQDSLGNNYVISYVGPAIGGP